MTNYPPMKCARQKLCASGVPPAITSRQYAEHKHAEWPPNMSKVQSPCPPLNMCSKILTRNRRNLRILLKLPSRF